MSAVVFMPRGRRTTDVPEHSRWNSVTREYEACPGSCETCDPNELQRQANRDRAIEVLAYPTPRRRRGAA